MLFEKRPGTIPVWRNWIPFATPVAAAMRWAQVSFRLRFSAKYNGQQQTIKHTTI